MADIESFCRFLARTKMAGVRTRESTAGQRRTKRCRISSADKGLRPIWAEPKHIGMHRPLTNRQSAAHCLPEMQTQRMSADIVDTEQTNDDAVTACRVTESDDEDECGERVNGPCNSLMRSSNSNHTTY